MLSMIFLNDAERAQLKIQHRHERDGRIRDRIKAVLLFDKGWSITAIAEALLLSDDAIREHINEYRESKKLKPENGGSIPKLSIEQSNELVYRNNLKNRILARKRRRFWRLERATIAEWQGASEDPKYAAKLTAPKTDSSGCFGISVFKSTKPYLRTDS